MICFENIFNSHFINLPVVCHETISFGFNISGRWNTGYKWESTFVDGYINEATVFDAQINYNIPKLKAIIKLGATNLGGKEYQQVLGAGFIGSQYFASLTLNP